MLIPNPNPNPNRNPNSRTSEPSDYRYMTIQVALVVSTGMVQQA